MNKPDVEPAYPCMYGCADANTGKLIPERAGMSLRDAIAIAAMAAFIQTASRQQAISGVDYVAKHAYRQADAMLKVRNE